jgi:sodium/bile acid cotransporter 7
VIVDLVCWLIVPLALGQLLRPALGKLAERHKPRISLIDRATILMLVYTSFCDSVKAHTWSSQGLQAVLLTLGASMFLLAAVMGGLMLLTRTLQLPEPDRIAVVFCGSKKTLASGVPMAGLLFGAHSALSLILLPIMIYHPLQLVVCGYMAGRWARRPPDPAHELVKRSATS